MSRRIVDAALQTSDASDSMLRRVVALASLFIAPTLSQPFTAVKISHFDSGDCTGAPGRLETIVLGACV